jgi:hypothetical protein
LSPKKHPAKILDELPSGAQILVEVTVTVKEDPPQKELLAHGAQTSRQHFYRCSTGKPIGFRHGVSLEP